MYRKRKRFNNSDNNGKASNKKKNDYSDTKDDFFQDDDMESLDGNSESSDDVEEEKVETVDEIRLRKAKEYLAKITGKDEDEEVGFEDISNRLREEAIEATGRMSYRKVDSMLRNIDVNTLPIKVLRGHQLSVTAVKISDDEKFIYSASKDCNIIKWNVETFTKAHVFKGQRNRPEVGGHTKNILCLALSSDGKLLASGGEDKIIRVWNTEENKLIDTFKGHKDIISGMVFRVGHHTLYTTSFDRSVKIWNCDEMSYTDTFYGHESNIHAIDTMIRERCVTCSYDKTARLWKIVEGTQLQYSGVKQSIECISLINEESFVTGSQDGSIQLWRINKRKPEFVHKKAHGEISEVGPNWITAIAALKYSNIFASGSSDGYIRIWCIENSKFELILSIPNVVGYVNSLQFSKSGGYLIAGIGQESRFGRWSKIKEAKNNITVIQLPIKK